MKITLRKVKSGALGEKYNSKFFTPIKLKSYQSSVSISSNAVARGVCEKYGIDYDNVNRFFKNHIFGVVIFVGKIELISVPSTYASDSASITKFSEEICNLVKDTRYLHFTHFCYLREKFPTNQIKKILQVFLKKNEIDCEICWDIDEKFIVEMQVLLEKCLHNLNIEMMVETYDEENFHWSSEYESYLIKKEIDKQRELEVYEEIINSRNNLPTNTRTNNMATRRNEEATLNELPARRVQTGAIGSAGEFYALSLFIRMGFVAGKAPEGTATYDLFVMSNNAFSFAPVQVKTITNGKHWLMNESHENVIDNLIYCFVLFTDILCETRIFLIPSDVVASALSMEVGIWLAIPGFNGRVRNRNTMRTLKMDYSSLIRGVENPQVHLSRKQLTFIREHSFGWLDKYENNFDIFKTQD
jgi:hypothetical protein